MEEILDNQPSSENLLTEKMRQWLIETAKWARFLAIVGFCFIGLMVLGLFSIGSMLSLLDAQTGMNSNMMAGAQFGFIVMFVLFIAFYFFPTLFLFQFATHTLKTAEHYDAEQLEIGLEKLKSFFKFVGVFTIVVLSLYAFIFLLALVR